MKKGNILFWIGLVIFMIGIYISTKWAIIGTLMGVGGGMLLGVSSYFIARKK